MKTKVKIGLVGLISCILLSGCNSVRKNSNSVVAIPIAEEHVTVVGKDGITSPSKYRVLYAGRRVDEHRPDFMHEGHFVYQRVHAEVFDTAPTEAAVIGTSPLLGIHNPVRKSLITGSGNSAEIAQLKKDVEASGKIDVYLEGLARTAADRDASLAQRLDEVEKATGTVGTQPTLIPGPPSLPSSR